MPDPAVRGSWTCPECGLRWESRHVWPRPWRPSWRPARHPDYGWLLYDERTYGRWARSEAAKRQWRRGRKRIKRNSRKEAQDDAD